jgi:hypothetical protein
MGQISMLKPEFIPRLLLSLILFGLGSALLIFANPPPPYSIWGIIIVGVLIGAGVLVLLIPSDKQIRKTGDASSADSSSDSKP